MNGGRKKWELERPPADHRRAVDVTATSYKAQRPEPGAARLMRDGAQSRRRGDGALVDVRSPAEFNGEIIAPPGLTETAQRCGPHPRRREHPVGPGGQRRRHLQVGRRAASAVRRQGRHAPTRTSSPTAASASARRTPGSCSRSCSASTNVTQLRRLVDRVGQRGGRADGEALGSG